MDASRAELEALLVDAYPYARSLAYMLCKSATDAEDLVQEAMTRALRAPPATLSPMTVRAWLRTTMTRESIRAGRVLASDLKAAFRLFLQPPPAPATTEMSATLLNVLRRLGPRQRACIVLRYVNDMSEEQIAETLGLAPGTVKAHLAQGRDKLRKILGTTNPGGGLPPL